MKRNAWGAMRGAAVCGLALTASVAGSAQSWATAIAGNALCFDGQRDYVRIPHQMVLSMDSMTLEAWVLVDLPAFYGLPVLSKGFDFGNYTLEIHGVDHPAGRSLGFAHQASGGPWSFDTPGGTFPVGGWAHVAVTIGPDARRLYIDGVLRQVFDGPGPTPLVNLDDLDIGRLRFSSGLPRYFAGCMDEVRVWNVPRTPAQVFQNHNLLVPPDSPGLVGYWNFDEFSPDQYVRDQSPSGADGTLGRTNQPDDDDPIRVKSSAPIVPEPAMGAWAILGLVVLARRGPRRRTRCRD